MPASNSDNANAPAADNSYLQTIFDVLDKIADFANLSILIQIIGKWVPLVASFAAMGLVSAFLAASDAIIYFFRGLSRLTRIIGREVFEFTFKQENNGVHPLQTVGDAFSLGFFALAITLFSGVLIASPVGITLAWASGIIALSIVTYFDYVYPAGQAYDKMNNLPDGPDKIVAEKDYSEKNIEKYFMLAILLGLSLLLICGSASVFAPPLLSTVLHGVAKGAGLFVILANVAKYTRKFYNSCVGDDGLDDGSLPPAPPLAPEESPSNSLHRRFSFVLRVGATSQPPDDEKSAGATNRPADDRTSVGATGGSPDDPPTSTFSISPAHFGL